MIITLKGCTATAYIGGLNFFKVSRGTVSGANLTISTSTINKDAATSSSAREIATVVLNTDYENLVVTVTMGGSSVNWYANGKVTIPANTTVTGDIKISASATAINVPDEPVTPTMYTFTINPTPTAATVTLTASGYNQSGNSITVPANTSVTWKVTASGYTGQNGTHVVTKTESKSVSLSAVSGGDFEIDITESVRATFSAGAIYGLSTDTNFGGAHVQQAAYQGNTANDAYVDISSYGDGNYSLEITMPYATNSAHTKYGACLYSGKGKSYALAGSGMTYTDGSIMSEVVTIPIPETTKYLRTTWHTDENETAHNLSYSVKIIKNN